MRHCTRGVVLSGCGQVHGRLTTFWLVRLCQQRDKPEQGLQAVGRFGSIEEARTFGQRFFPWSNYEHRHSGIAPLTPDMLHYSRAEEYRAKTKGALPSLYPQFRTLVRSRPKHPPQPTAVWINLPSQTTATLELDLRH
jgi:hypothetical protein